MDEGSIVPASSSNNKGLTEDREGFVSGVDNNIPGWSVEANGARVAMLYPQHDGV